MKKKIQFKHVWIALNFLLLALPVFIPSVSYDVANICLIITMILSYPLSLILMKFLFLVGWFDAAIGTLFLLSFAFSVLAYVQWFVIVPFLVKLIKKQFFAKDLQINFSASVEPVKKLSVAENNFNAAEWQKKWYDEEKRTPVERIFDKQGE